VNLLTKTEDFSDAVWVKLPGGTGVNPITTINAGIAPNGTNTATQVIFNTGSGTTLSDQSLIEQGGVGLTSIGPNYKSGLWIKGNVGTQIQIRHQAATAYTLYTLTGNWDYFTQNEVSALTAIRFCIGLRQGANGTINSNITVLVWGADLRPTNAGALLPPYQRVNTASDYDSAGFPLYLKANGTSSAMSTNSIDFTSTDKMTVVTGVRKLSDANFSVFTELSADLNATNNSFYIGNHASSLVSAYGFASKGTVVDFKQDDNTKIAPISNVITMQSSISTPQLIGRVDAITKITSSATQGIGNFGNYPIYLFARAGTSSHLNGHFYGAIIRGAQSDTASVVQTEQYMAQKTGITF
jgi:hypothetical protein